MNKEYRLYVCGNDWKPAAPVKSPEPYYGAIIRCLICGDNVRYEAGNKAGAEMLDDMCKENDGLPQKFEDLLYEVSTSPDHYLSLKEW